MRREHQSQDTAVLMCAISSQNIYIYLFFIIIKSNLRVLFWKLELGSSGVCSWRRSSVTWVKLYLGEKKNEGVSERQKVRKKKCLRLSWRVGGAVIVRVLWFVSRLVHHMLLTNLFAPLKIQIHMHINRHQLRDLYPHVYSAQMHTLFFFFGIGSVILSVKTLEKQLNWRWLFIYSIASLSVGPRGRWCLQAPVETSSEKKRENAASVWFPRLKLYQCVSYQSWAMPVQMVGSSWECCLYYYFFHP